MSNQPKILSEESLPLSEAKWVTLKKITWQDDKGVQRFWESAQRTTRKATGIDAVAIFALIRSKTNAFPLSTIIIEQYRPPVGKFVVGLMDENETPEKAALRELHEETGYIGEEVVDVSPMLATDPGMTNSIMKLVSVAVTCKDQLETPEQKLDDGESITLRIVELSKLNQILKVDAKLAMFATAYDLGRNPKFQ
ncbi:NUDIX hydrolase domain-like protein [Thelephora terrestris]|uniref:NUDIX hydrolase domain-like protein n=1 Tax=Thelephora terrestris TaxID=56493 RepID=A0A9P6L5E1_9AGAM|nr:NUDIX hydrolase domain-like protein [Thelephora terrestris]